MKVGQIVAFAFLFIIKVSMSNATELDKTSSRDVAPPLRPTRGFSQIAYDFKNKELIAVKDYSGDSCTLTHIQPDATYESLAATKVQATEVLEMSDTQRRMKTLDTLIEATASDDNDSLHCALERTKHLLKKRSEADAEKKMPLHYFADTWNILRFIKGSSNGVNISPNGLNLSIKHSHKGQDRQREDELVLTNMSFTSGLHFWEIIAQIGCNNIQVGVHNPITKSEVMTSFKTKVKRVITVCLDLFEGTLKFWLNDNFIEKKVIKLVPVGGPWVPCVKIGKERNCLTLNPFANPPTSFGEANLDRGCRLDTILMPLLTNYLCVTGLPQIEANTQSETLKILNQIFQHSNNQISDIHMAAPGSKNMFCFIKFHHYTHMVDFLDRHRPAGKFKIYEAHEIFEWFLSEKPPNAELEQPFAVIKKAIALSSKSLTSTIACITESYSKLKAGKTLMTATQKSEQVSKNAGANHVEIALQVFSDKLIVTKPSSNQVKAVSRSNATQEFNTQDICFSEDHQGLTSLIQLVVNKHSMLSLMETIPWQRVFKASLVDGFDRESAEFKKETVYQGLFFQFFKGLTNFYNEVDGTQVKFYSSIFAAKQVLDALMFHVKRLIRTYETKKPEQESPDVLILPFSQAARSVDELKQLLYTVSDLQEQLWAKTRSEQCLPEVKYLCQTVSRPQSALNRLGSFVQWPFTQDINSVHSTSPFDLAENGFYLKSTEVASSIHTPQLEITDFTPSSFSLQKPEHKVREMIGLQNASLCGLPSQNVPLYKSLNYLAPQKFTSVSEVVSSQNTSFVLVGGLNGTVSICSSQLHLTPIKTIQFFSQDVHKKRQKYLEVYSKLEARNQACIEYQQAICKKEQQIPFIQDLAKRKSKTAPKKIKKKQQSKLKKSASPTALKVEMSNSKMSAKSVSKVTKNLEKDLKAKSVNIVKEKSVVEELKENAQKAAKKIMLTAEKEKEKKALQSDSKFPEEKIISINKEVVDAPTEEPQKRQRTNSSSINVLGYTMLSKQGATIDPLMVGCVYQNQSDEPKFFIKLRRLMFQVSYILNFIHGSHLSGNLTNLVSGYQTMQRKMSKEQLEAILRHQDVLIDLVPTFVRTQVTKKQYPKWESRFPTMMLSEVNEEDLELKNVDRIVDFTSVVYSISSQSYIHILGSQSDAMHVIQLRVDHSYGVETIVGKIKLLETARLQVSGDALRVFQVDDKIVVLCPSKALIYRLEDLSYISQIEINATQNHDLASKAQICNETDKNNIYTAKNIQKFKDAGRVPQQQWTLCLVDQSGKFHKFLLVSSDQATDQSTYPFQKLSPVSDLREAIKKAHGSEIEKIPVLFKAHKTGLRLKSYPRNDFEPSFALQDTDTDLYTRLFFKKLTNKDDTWIFTVDVGSNNTDLRPLPKKLDLQLSFKRSQPTKVSALQQENNAGQSAWMNLNQTIMRLPLLVEHLKGSQSGETVYACHLTAPDSQVFVSNYPQPEFIFKHAEGKQVLLTQVTLWSKISKESQGGFPIGEGFVFFADSLADLMDCATLKKAVKAMKEELTDDAKTCELSCLGLDAVYFNFKDQERVTVDLAQYRACKFIKVIPTGFRRAPINYADCQDFSKDQAELQFFGASGYILESLLHELPEPEKYCANPELNVRIGIEVMSNTNEIAYTDQVTISRIRTPSCLSSYISATDAISTGLGVNAVGLAQISLPLSHDEMSYDTFTVQLNCETDQDWQLSGINISLEAIKLQAQSFITQGMKENISAISDALLHESPNSLEPAPLLVDFVEAMVEIVQGNGTVDDVRRMQAVLCLSKLVVDSTLLSETQRSHVIQIVQMCININQLFSYSVFIEKTSPELQKHIINFVELVGLKKKPATRKATNILIIQVFSELSASGKVCQLSIKGRNDKLIVDQRHLLSIDVLKNVLNLVSRKRRPFVVSKFTDLIYNEWEVMIQQESAYFKLRSLLEINAFPFDIDYMLLDQFNPVESSVQSRGQALPCDFQLIKINSSYTLKAQLHETSVVDAIKLHFKMNSAKCIHRFKVQILLHQPDEPPVLLFVKTFDESTFAHVTKHAGDSDEAGRKKSKKEDEKENAQDSNDYFDIYTKCTSDAHTKVNTERLDKAQDLLATYAHPFSSEYDRFANYNNQVVCQLDQITAEPVFGKMFEIQVELLDTYRTIHKATAFSQVMIIPEFMGNQTPTPTGPKPEDEVPQLNKDLEDLQGESLSLTVPSLDIKSRKSATKDASIRPMKKNQFIPNKYLPANFINKISIGELTYEVYSGLAADKTMKSVINNFMFKHVQSLPKAARQADDKGDEEQVYQDLAEQLITAQQALRDELAKESTVKESKSGMARINQMCQQISKLKSDLYTARMALPIDQEFLKTEMEVKIGSTDQKSERPGFRENGYQTFVSKTDASVWFQLHQKNNSAILKYAFAMTELACIYLQQVYIRDPHLIKEPTKLYKHLFKVHITQDTKDAHPIMEEFLQVLYSEFSPEDRRKLFFDLVSEILIKPSNNYNFANFLSYIQSDRIEFIGINEVMQQLNNMFMCGPIKCEEAIKSEAAAIEFLKDNVVRTNPTRRGTTKMFIDGNTESKSGMVIAALSFFVEHVSYRLRLCHENESSNKTTAQLRREMQAKNPQMMHKISLSSLSRFGAWQIVNNAKFQAGSTHFKATAFLLLFTEVLLKLTSLNMEELGQTIIGQTLVPEEWLIILLAITQSGQAKIQQNFSLAIINLMSASKYEIQREIVQVFNNCLAYLLAQDVSLSQKVYRNAEAKNNNGFSQLFSHYQSLVRIQTKVINIISAKMDQEPDRSEKESKFAKTFRKQQTLPTQMTRTISKEFRNQIEIQNKKLGEFIKKLLRNLNLFEVNKPLTVKTKNLKNMETLEIQGQPSVDKNEDNYSQISVVSKQSSPVDVSRATSVLVEIYQSLTFLQDLEARAQVTQAIVRQLDQLQGAQQIDFSKSILSTSQQLVCTPEKMKVNSELLLSLIETIITQKLVADKFDLTNGSSNKASQDKGQGNDRQDPSRNTQHFFQIFCRQLICLLLTGSNAKMLPKRTEAEKAEAMHRKDTAFTFLEPEHIQRLLALLAKFLTIRCSQYSSSTKFDTCTILLDLSIANKLCELCLYSKHSPSLEALAAKQKPDYALSTVVLTKESTATIENIKSLLTFLVFTKLEDDEGTKNNASTSFRTPAKLAQLCQKVSNIVIAIGKANNNAILCLPALMDTTKWLDWKITDLVKEKLILDLRGMQLQQNANEIFLRMLVSWIQTTPEVPENDVSYKFLHELDGFDFIIGRLSSSQQQSLSAPPNTPAPMTNFTGLEPFSPLIMSRGNSQLKSAEPMLSVSDDEVSSDNSEGVANVLKFVGNKLGMSLVKATSQKVPKAYDVGDRRDTELLADAKQAKTFMRKQTALVKQKDTTKTHFKGLKRALQKEMKKKDSFYDFEDDAALNKESKVKEQLIEKNYATVMKLVDCTEGEEITNERQTLKWNVQYPNQPAIQLVVGTGDERKQEYQLTFDLGEAVQFTEVTVTLENPDKGQNQNYRPRHDTKQTPQTAKPEYPYTIILEGKKSAAFLKEKKANPIFWDASTMQDQTGSKKASQDVTVDQFLVKNELKPEIKKESVVTLSAQNEEKLDEQVKQITVGNVEHPDWSLELQQNPNKPFEFSVSQIAQMVCDTSRREAQYLRFRFVFSDQILCTTAAPNEMTNDKRVVDKNAKATAVQRAINLVKISVLGANCLDSKDIMIELAQMKRKNAMNSLAEYFTKAPTNVLAKITQNYVLQQRFIASFDKLEPFLLLNSAVILPIFIQMASMSEELCNQLMQNKILLDFYAFDAKNSFYDDLIVGEEEEKETEIRKEKELQVMLELLEGLVMSKPEKQVSRLATVLEYVLSQTTQHAEMQTFSEAKLHISFLIGIANLFVECASIIAKELAYRQSKSEQPEQKFELVVSNQDISCLISLASLIPNQAQQRSVTFFAIFLLQLPKPFIAPKIDLKAFVKDNIINKCNSITPVNLPSLELLSLLLLNQPADVDPLIADFPLIDHLLNALQKKLANKNEEDSVKLTDEQIIDVIHIIYNCLGSNLGRQSMVKIALEFYNSLKPVKIDDRVVTGAEKIKYGVAQAMATTLLQIVNIELQQSTEAQATQQLVSAVRQDIMLLQDQQTPKDSKKESKKERRKKDSSNLFVTLVFEPLLKLRITVPVSVNLLMPEQQGLVRIKQFYKALDKSSSSQTILPSDLLSKDNVDLIMKGLRQQNSAHGLQLSDDVFKQSWQKLLEVDCNVFSETDATELMSIISNKKNLMFMVTLKVDSCQNVGILPENEQYLMNMVFFCPSVLEPSNNQEKLVSYGNIAVIEPNPKDCKGSFFVVCAPEKIGSAIFIHREQQNQYSNDFQVMKFDNGDNTSSRYCFYMMNQIVTSWEPKILQNQQIWLNFSERIFQNDDDNVKKVLNQVNCKQGLLQKFTIFHFNQSKLDIKQDSSRDIGVPRYQLVGARRTEGKKAVKKTEIEQAMPLVDQFSSLSVLHQNLIVSVPIDCRLSTLAKQLKLPSDVKFVNTAEAATGGLLGAAYEGDVTIEQLAKASFGRILELYTQIPVKEEPAAEKETKRVFKKVEAKSEAKKEETKEVEQVYKYSVFDKYLGLGGSGQMIEMALKTVSTYRNKKMKEQFIHFLEDLKMFSILPGFSDLYFEPQDKKELLLQMLKKDYADISLPKKKESTQYQKAQQEINQRRTQIQKQTAEAYEVIEKLFNQSSDNQEDVESTIKHFINSGVFQNLLKSISMMSGEFTRKKASQDDKQANEKSEPESQDESSEESLVEEQSPLKFKKKAAVQEEKDMINSEDSEWDDQELIKQAIYDAQEDDKDAPNTKVTAKKGVGYTTEVGEVWDVNAYLKMKETKNASLLRVFRIIQKFLEILAKVMETGEDYFQGMRVGIIESAVLPTIESALRSGSLLEMAKEMELYQTYINFIEKMASIPSLFDLILELPDEYEPKQRDSVLALLSKNKNLSEVFIACLDQNESAAKISKAETDEVKNPKLLANLFIEATNRLSKIAQQKANMEQQKNIESILAMPIEKQYITLLDDQRFNYYSFRSGKKATDKLDHYHGKEENNAKNPPSKKLIRLAQEIADLTNSLPIEHTSAIFCRVDKKRVDFMKCLIMGATGTPYANGAFTFDIFFDNKYPEGPPKVQLTTTGGGQVRFNPNLYACGKVCLSLLGTWRGQSTENWDPKVSTTLQVLMSIQAIIMSNEVYFNEPGHEQEAGTVDGEKRNTGYSNIIRYATAKYAILDHLENPTKGFEQAIHRSFFVKKKFILDELDEWIREAEKHPASYQNLVLDHNYNLGQKFQKDGEYLKDLKAVREDVKIAFDKLKLEQSGNVSFNGKVYGSDEEEETSKSVAIVQSKEASESTKDFQKALDQIDVSYSNTVTPVTGQTINVDDEKVKDRWSRYIGAMGIEAVAKQAESTVFVSGLGPLGVEIAKNIILAGCKELILHDTCSPIAQDLDGQFFLEEKDVGSSQTRAQLSQMKIQELNTFVKVTVLPRDIDLEDYFSAESCKVKTAVFTDCHRQQFTASRLTAINDKCRSRTQMIIADNNGLFCRVITDFGPSHTIVDVNGEPAAESMVESIVADEKTGTLITLIKGAVHGLQEGDTIELTEVKGMNKLDVPGEEQIDTSSKAAANSGQSINGNRFKVLKTLTTSKFVIDCDMTAYSKFERDGVVRQIKMPFVMESKPLKDVLGFNDGATLDYGFFLDFEKLTPFKATSICYRAFADTSVTKEAFFKTCLEHFNKDEGVDRCKEVANVFWETRDFYMPPLCAFLGGVVAQEVVKGITQKFTCIRQEFYFDAIELFEKGQEGSLKRYKSLNACLGEALVTKIQNTKLFMIGAGAIGCELLKNFAMLGMGTGASGLITLTDPDVIEVSNLNRQFLFREKHLRKPKSMTAAAASIQMNPHLKGHIDARLDKVSPDTVNIYSEDFFTEQHLVANALDNLQARLFIDSKCVNARVPLLDSGTLGPKGHVQVIIPFKTESYASQRDPEENTAIPHCTLKMFPEETLHCVEWAKDIFGTLFTLNPQNFNKLKTTEIGEIEFHQSTEFKNIKQVIKMAQNRPTTFDDCIRLARIKFQKYFHDNILQLLHVYPLDKKLADGRLFWTLPKRPPTAQIFDAEAMKNTLHRDFISAYACLTAKVYGITIPFDQPRTQEAKVKMAKIADSFEVKPFVSNDQKANALESQVEKQNKQSTEQQADEAVEPSFDPSQLREQFVKHVGVQALKDFTMKCEEFEKDDDSNFHIDFIYACANIRALNYGLKEMDWLTVKLKAGRIVPALATTTAAIAGLQTIELLKLLKVDQLKLAHFKNTYLNLAVPSMMSSEPGAPNKTKIKDSLETDLWDRWSVDISAQTTMGEVVAVLEERYKLSCRDIIFESTPVFMYALRDRKLPLMKQPALTKAVKQLLSEVDDSGKNKVLDKPGSFVDLTITFVDPDVKVQDDQEQILQNIPTVRLIVK